MNKQVKKLTKELRKLTKRLDPTDGLTLRTSYDTRLSLHRNSRDQNPLLTFGSKGEYSIPVIKLIFIILLAVSGISLIALMVSRVRETLAKRRARRGARFIYDLDEDDELAE